MAAGDGGAVMLGGDTLRQRMQERARRYRNLKPVMDVIGREMVRQSYEAIERSTSPDGERFPSLAESTRLARRGAKGLEARLNKRTEAGALTKGAQRARAKFAGQELARSLKGGRISQRLSKRLPGMTSDGSTMVWARPLFKTGKLLRSIKYRADAKGCRFMYRDYGKHHARPTGKLPRRNFTVFRWEGGRWVANRDFMQWALGKIARFVDQGAL